MRRHLITPTSTVDLHHSVGVDREPLVGVDHHAEQARVGLVDANQRLVQVGSKRRQNLIRGGEESENVWKDATGLKGDVHWDSDLEWV